MNTALEITTRIGCANDCHFCPQDQLHAAFKSPERVMSLKTFVQCFETVPPTVRVDFSGMVEPFFNPLAPLMIWLAKRWGRTVYVYSTLMGLQADKVEELPEVDYMKVHVPDVKGLIVPDEDWIKQHELFRQWGQRADYMSMGPLTPAVAEYLAGLNIAVEQPTMLSRGGNLWKSVEKRGHLVCKADRWHSNMLLPDGSVYGCCMDYGLTVPLGNLREQSYAQIWNAAEVWKASNKQSGICTQCEWAELP